MVGIVVVSHSEKLAQSLVELSKQMAPEVNIVAAGGRDDGEFGTSYEKIKNAILSVYNQDGVLVIADMGSSVMSAQMVVEEIGKDNIKICDCPFFEGTFKAAIDSLNYKTIDEIEPTWDNSLLNK